MAAIALGFAVCAVLVLLGQSDYYVESALDKLWLDPNGNVKAEIDYMDKYTSRPDFSSTTEIGIMKAGKSGTVMNSKNLEAFQKFSEAIMNIVVEVDGSKYTTMDVQRSPCSLGTLPSYVALGLLPRGENYDLPATLTPIMAQSLGNFENVGAVALSNAAMLENALVDQCGANFLPCLFDDSDANTSKVVGDLVVPSLSPFERMGAICTVAPSACSARM